MSEQLPNISSPPPEDMVKIMRGFLRWRNSDRLKAHIAANIPKGLRRQTEGDEYGVHHDPTLPDFSGSKAEAETYSHLFILGALATVQAAQDAIPYRSLEAGTVIDLESKSKVIARTFEGQQDPPPGLMLEDIHLQVAQNLHTGLEEQGYPAAESAKIALDAIRHYLANQAGPAVENQDDSVA